MKATEPRLASTDSMQIYLYMRLLLAVNRLLTSHSLHIIQYNAIFAILSKALRANVPLKDNKLIQRLSKSDLITTTMYKIPQCLSHIQHGWLDWQRTVHSENMTLF